MGLAFCCLMAFSLFVVFWGNLAMALCTQNWFLFATGLLILAILILLTWMIAFAYWAIERWVCRAKIKSDIKKVRDTQNTKEKCRLEERLKEETWGDVFCASCMVLLYVTIFGIGAPIYFVANIKCFLLDLSKQKTSSKSA